VLGNGWAKAVALVAAYGIAVVATPAGVSGARVITGSVSGSVALHDG
jgi:hypothetical protein